MTRTCKTRNRFAPRFEVLEDRTLLATCHVTRLSDAGAGMGFRGDLRFCINKVNAMAGSDSIQIHRTGTINLTGALPDLSSDMDILGPGADLLTVRRNTNPHYRIFTVTSSSTVLIEGLTISNGVHHLQSSFGGGISNAGNLTVVRCVISDNVAFSDHNTGNGGGIYNATTGNLTVIESTIKDNRVLSGFGNVGYGGGICNDGFASIYSSTISDNRASDLDTYLHGAGISNWCWYFGPGGVLVLHNSTVTGNSGVNAVYSKGPLTVISHSTISGNESIGGALGGGILIDPDSTVHMRNTIVADNGSPGDINGTLAGSGYNLIGDSESGSGYAPTDILDADPMLGPLADNGGPTLTIALLPGSPAIDAGDNADAPEFDQRGLGFPRIINGTIDIGAFEVQSRSTPPISRLSSLPGADFLSMFLATADFEALD